MAFQIYTAVNTAPTSAKGTTCDLVRFTQPHVKQMQSDVFMLITTIPCQLYSLICIS